MGSQLFSSEGCLRVRNEDSFTEKSISAPNQLIIDPYDPLRQHSEGLLEPQRVLGGPPRSAEDDLLDLWRVEGRA